jgi:DNA-binding MarR family transcriptional regulator
MSRTLLDEIKQTRPFPSRGSEALVSLLRTANLVRRHGEEMVQKHGLTMQQYNVLRILRGARAPLPTMEIAERMIESAPGITRHINNLEERGLVRREQWGGDRRCVLCQISPAGLKVLESLDGPVTEWDAAIVRRLSEEQLTTLLQSLDLIRAALEE